MKGCFPRIADHFIFFSALFLTRWVDLGTAGLFVPCVEKFYCHPETIAIPWGKLSVEEGFRLPSIFYDFKFLSSFKGGGSDDLGWALEWLLMTERRPRPRCTRLSAESEKSLLSTTLILLSGFERENSWPLPLILQSGMTLLGFSRSNYYNFAFIWHSYFVPGSGSFKDLNGHRAVKSEIVPSFSNVDKYSSYFG